MRKRTIALGALALAAVAGGGWYASLDKETRGLLAAMPTDRDVLMWKQDQRDAAFRAMDRLPVLAKANTFAASPSPAPLPAGKPLKLVVKNEDKTAEEFESLALRVEKVIKGGGETTLNVKPLKPGRYKFVGEYHEKTAVGYLVAK